VSKVREEFTSSIYLIIKATKVVMFKLLITETVIIFANAGYVYLSKYSIRFMFFDLFH